METPDNNKLVDATSAFRPAPKKPSIPEFSAQDLINIGVQFVETESSKLLTVPFEVQKKLIGMLTGYGFGQSQALNELLNRILRRFVMDGPIKSYSPENSFDWCALMDKNVPKEEAAPEPIEEPELEVEEDNSTSGERGTSNNLTTAELLQMHEETCAAARDIMRVKNHDYTDGSVDPFANFRTSEILGVPAELGILIRSLDKFKRIQTFVNKGTLKVKNESVNDAIEDVVNYMILLKGIIASRA